MSPIKREYRPFLRWAGGKNWLVKQMPSFVNQIDIKRYHEPFLGGGSIFFALAPREACLSDVNDELIRTYKALKEYPEKVLATLKRWPVSESQYYKVRALQPTVEHIVAARFIYLNRTSYNGIYRVNRFGKYNVPYGHNDQYKFDYARLKAASEALQYATLTTMSFADTIGNIQCGDFVFLDPPYTVSHNKNGFIAYNKTLFSLDDQKRLKEYVNCVNEIGAYYVLTNAAHQAIADIFNKDCKMIEVSRKCLLGGSNAKRGNTEEFIFTNIPTVQIGECNG